MKTIASRQNPLFKRIREAIREHAGEIVLEGPKQIHDALRSAWAPIAIVTRGESAEFANAIAFEPRAFDALADTKTSQGAIALFERPHFEAAPLFARRDTIVVALDAVQDPGNVGTIVRLAAAFDAAGIVLLPGCADPLGPKAIRASVGAVLQVPFVSMTVDELVAQGLPLYAADGSAAPLEPPSAGAVFVFGNEGSGVSTAIRAHATPIAIATSGRVESLNVAASAAILLSRSFAQRAAPILLRSPS
jgi:TrmH family RNA methyltransferase